VARKCTICEHKDRNKIDSAVAVKGASLRTIATQYRITISSLRRHISNGHIAEKIVQAQHAHEVIEADTILSQMQTVKNELWIIHKEARDRKTNDGDKYPDNPLALKTLTQLDKHLETESKILGVNPEPPANPVTVNLNIAEEVRKLVGILPAVKR
jgi:hypothetical protein